MRHPVPSTNQQDENHVAMIVSHLKIKGRRLRKTIKIHDTSARLHYAAVAAVLLLC